MSFVFCPGQTQLYDLVTPKDQGTLSHRNSSIESQSAQPHPYHHKVLDNKPNICFLACDMNTGLLLRPGSHCYKSTDLGLQRTLFSLFADVFCTCFGYIFFVLLVLINMSYIYMLTTVISGSFTLLSVAKFFQETFIIIIII